MRDWSDEDGCYEGMAATASEPAQTFKNPFRGCPSDWMSSMPDGRGTLQPPSCSGHTTPTARMEESRQLSMMSLCGPDSEDAERTELAELCSDICPCTSDGMRLSAPSSIYGVVQKLPGPSAAAAPPKSLPNRRSSSSLPRQLLSCTQVSSNSSGAAAAATAAAAAVHDSMQEQQGSLDSSTDWTPLLRGPGLPGHGPGPATPQQLRALVNTRSGASSAAPPQPLPAAPSLQSWAAESLEGTIGPASAPSLAASPPAAKLQQEAMYMDRPPQLLGSAECAGGEKAAAAVSSATGSMVGHNVSGCSTPQVEAAKLTASAEPPVMPAQTSTSLPKQGGGMQQSLRPQSSAQSVPDGTKRLHASEEGHAGSNVASDPYTRSRQGPADLSFPAIAEEPAGSGHEEKFDAALSSEKQPILGATAGTRLPFRLRSDSAVYHRADGHDGPNAEPGQAAPSPAAVPDAAARLMSTAEEGRQALVDPPAEQLSSGAAAAVNCSEDCAAGAVLDESTAASQQAQVANEAATEEIQHGSKRCSYEREVDACSGWAQDGRSCRGHPEASPTAKPWAAHQEMGSGSGPRSGHSGQHQGSSVHASGELPKWDDSARDSYSPQDGELGDKAWPGMVVTLRSPSAQDGSRTDREVASPHLSTVMLHAQADCMAAGLVTGARKSDLAGLLVKGHERHREAVRAEQQQAAHAGSSSRAAQQQQPSPHQHHPGHHHHSGAGDSSSRSRSGGNLHRTDEATPHSSSRRDLHRRAAGAAAHSAAAGDCTAARGPHASGSSVELRLTPANLAELEAQMKQEARRDKRDVHERTRAWLAQLELSSEVEAQIRAVEEARIRRLAVADSYNAQIAVTKDVEKVHVPVQQRRGRGRGISRWFACFAGGKAL